VDLCVIGGGLAGMCAAIAAARHGSRVVLMQDRPVLGGNASSECRVGIGGADRGGQIPHVRETGIIDELRLETLYRNPNDVYSLQDTVYYERVFFEPNLTPLLNCTCQKVEMGGNRIARITGWQMTTETEHTIEAQVFADCSGDAILAPLTGAEFRIGREARKELDESIAPEVADSKTMGMTLLFFSREYDTPQPFTPPEWAYTFKSCDDLPFGERDHSRWVTGYWWVELGGEYDSIHDTEKLRDELLKIEYGVWDHLKNHCQHKDQLTNWALDWMQFLPAKRESRRYMGDYMLTENDIRAQGKQFPDPVAHGGWTMDDHHPAGFWSVKVPAPATIWHPCPSPFAMPYRMLYSHNIDNLMFAGRDASASHAAMSSTRLIATCAVMGQVVGTAAAIATRESCTPRQVGQQHLQELQQTLLRDDCYIPWVQQEFGPLTAESALEASQGDPEPLRDGINRQVDSDHHAWLAHPGDTVSYRFPEAAEVHEVTLLLDADLAKGIGHKYSVRRTNLTAIPEVMPRRFQVDGLVDGQWQTLAAVDENRQRLYRLPVGRVLEGVRFRLDETWGAPTSEVFAFYVD
jgi:hypothetical protein